MATTPKFVVTNVGLAAADVATPVGPFIHVTGFRIGSSYGYQAQPTDTDINGTLLYQGTPSTYQYVGNNTLNIVCKIPTDAGPFDFGEVAIDMDGPVMFAKAVFDTLQTKFTSLGTNVLSTFTFNCLLKLEQPVAIFKIDTFTGDPPSVWEVDFWSDVYPPALSANPLIPCILVRELDVNGNSSFLHQADDQHWTIGTNYLFKSQPLVAGGTPSYLDVLASDLSPDILSNVNNNYVVEFSTGYCRSISSVTVSGLYYRFTFNPSVLPVAPITASPVSIYTNTLIPTPAQTAYWLNTPGPISFTVPPRVYKLWVTGVPAGGGGGGAAGSSSATDAAPAGPYVGGGGGGGGGSGSGIQNYEIDVTPGQVLTGFLPDRANGGIGGTAQVNGTDGQDGGSLTFGPLVLLGGAGGKGGNYNPDSGGKGGPGGSDGIDGKFGGAGGEGGGGPFGTGGGGARGGDHSSPATLNGGDAGGAGTGGGGGGTVYLFATSGPAGNGGRGSQGYVEVSWNTVYSNN